MHEFGRVSQKSHIICLKEFLLTCCTSASVYFAPSFFSLSLPFPDSSGCCQLELGSLPGVGVPTLSRGSARLHLMGRRTIRIIVLFLADWVQSSQPAATVFLLWVHFNYYLRLQRDKVRPTSEAWFKNGKREIFQNLTSYYRQSNAWYFTSSLNDATILIHSINDCIKFFLLWSHYHVTYQTDREVMTGLSNRYSTEQPNSKYT